MTHPLNRYRDYKDDDLYEYGRRQYNREEEYWRSIDREIERDYFGNEDEDY